MKTWQTRIPILRRMHGKLVSSFSRYGDDYIAWTLDSSSHSYSRVRMELLLMFICGSKTVSQRKPSCVKFDI